MAEKSRAIVLLSGGLNSAVMLHDILTFKKAEIAECMIFDSGTPDALRSAQELCNRNDLWYSVWDYPAEPVVDPLAVSPADDRERALLFTTIISHAIHRAAFVEADTIYGGFCDETMPFDREALIQVCLAIVRTARTEDPRLEFEFPFLVNEKWRVLDLARQLNCLAAILSETSSCDKGDASIQHAWGYGCGSCRGCVARWKAWDDYLQILATTEGP